MYLLGISSSLKYSDEVHPMLEFQGKSLAVFIIYYIRFMEKNIFGEPLETCCIRPMTRGTSQTEEIGRVIYPSWVLEIEF